MVLDFLLMPQAHKFRDGYNINHDILINVSPQARQKLIFYFIAEQIPQKLSPNDRSLYEREKLFNIGLPRTFCLLLSLFTPLVLGFRNKVIRINKPREVLTSLFMGCLVAPMSVATFNRVSEGRFVESSKLIEELSNKYQFGIYDFSVAKKESHLLKLMQSLDVKLNL